MLEQSQNTREALRKFSLKNLAKKALEKLHPPPLKTGSVVYKEGLGFYIQPNDDEYAVVGFPPIQQKNFETLPENYHIDDKVRFSLEPNHDGNARTVSKYKKPLFKL
jgi:hypothetical protein